MAPRTSATSKAFASGTCRRARNWPTASLIYAAAATGADRRWMCDTLHHGQAECVPAGLGAPENVFYFVDNVG